VSHLWGAVQQCHRNSERAAGAQGNSTLVVNIGSLSDAMGQTSTAAASVLTAPSDLTVTAETLSREVEAFFRNLRADPVAA
jgi:methyl-accepting chemotaxis protein